MNVNIPLISSTDYIVLGVDIGSTTAKIVVIKDNKVVFTTYERHFSQVRQKTLEILQRVRQYIDRPVKVAISGSAGLGLARQCEIPFVQEVFATAETVKALEKDTSVVIELGGEDAKVIFFKGGTDERMNGSCAGGTGAFIDQMATLMNLTVDDMDILSLKAEKIYPVASRCGVFAKSDIQPLLNQGASKADIAASIYTAVVNQTIAGLAQGRKIDGKVMFLGGPLSFCKGLQKAFVKALKLSEENAIFPEYAKLSVSLGAAIYADKQNVSFDFEELLKCVESATGVTSARTSLPPLFENQEEYDSFVKRHENATTSFADISKYNGNAYLGVDCGSTTTKLVLISDNNEILYSYYNSNKGNPVQIVKEQLEKIYKLCDNRITIMGSAVTGYGEELIKNAFDFDRGIVETMAHYKAASYFSPDVDFILDIGGQDIKCFKIRNKAIDSIMLNEACSSGCGSFIETFAKSMGYSIAEFAEKGLFAKNPVDLGSRCTVFMNSSVKEAQKDGASVEDISAGLSMSVVKNAIYKVIRANSASELGSNIVVQGGTFYNNAVLRAFELELSHNVTRPKIAGLMGAFGAALYVKSKALDKSSLISPDALESFEHKAVAASCKGCTNNCRLTVNTFGSGKKSVSGNKCEKGSGQTLSQGEMLPNLHEIKRQMFDELVNDIKTDRKYTIGLPLGLGMYELAPFWKAIFENLGFSVVFSGFGSRKLYSKGQYSIPSDTACYPAKLMHGHIETLVEKGVNAVFYPCLTYNFDENSTDNHYNCPVVAYYSELLYTNADCLQNTKFMYPYLNINNKKELYKGLLDMLSEYFPDMCSSRQIKKSIDIGYSAYGEWMSKIYEAGKSAIDYARTENKLIMILAGRPYHIDPEVGHGIDKLASQLGFVVLSEDSLAPIAEGNSQLDVINQWTYHSRLYKCAEYACSHSDTQLVQLVSFGCGLDAITTDETRAILEEHSKLYTQIKIDEITNLGAVKIRLRSLLGAIAQK